MAKGQGAIELERLEGVLSRVRFTSDDGQFSVCELEVQERVLPVTLVGDLLSTRVGESVEVWGRWHQDRRYGEQFRIDRIETILPTTREGIEKYLSSGLMEGIGPTLARRIVAYFGEDTLGVIDRSPERLREVPGIGEKRFAQIRDAWEEGRRVHRIMVFLRSHGVSASLAVKIHRQFGEQAVEIIQRNPYRLVEDVRGIGFQTADQIARHVGIRRDSPERIRAGILHVLGRSHDDGHLFYPALRLEEAARDLLGEGVGSVDDSFEELRLGEKIFIEGDGEEGAAVYLKRAYLAEKRAAEHLRRLIGEERPVEADELRGFSAELGELEGEMSIELEEAQRQAVLSVFEHSFSVITGGPGTGKTTIVRAICELAKRQERRIRLAAPTGRAARRLSEATGERASTIHRLLEFNFHEGGFQYHEENPLELDILVVDEASMIDIYLLLALVRAVPTGATVVFVGDIDQLSSVGPGQVLQDLIESGAPKVTRLTEIFRQAKRSPIVTNAHRINQGLMPVDPPREEGELVEFYTINAPDPARAKAQILALATERIPRAFGLRAGEDIQILSPMYRGEVGCDSLNEALQEAFTAGEPQVKRGKRVFRLGDRVMQTSNNYEEDVFNGDIGRVVAVDEEEGELVVDFDGQEVKYPMARLDQLSLAYAVTVHKSQGSEYPAVIIPVMTQHFVMLQRNLLYTAVTRGAGLVILVGTERALRIAVNNGAAGQRYSGLGERLVSYRS